jgi:Heterokaryon incompatibility protein (HET)
MFDADPLIPYGHEKIPGLKDSVFLAVIKRRDQVVDIDLETLNGLRETGFICRPQEQHSSPPTICARLLRSESADFDLIKEWLSFCQDHHRQRCALKESTPVPGLKFIDCFTRQIVMATEGMEYLALSYVWGPGLTSGDDSLSGPFLPDNIPQTISDALVVTRKLQYRYLWIDRYCIAQNSPEEKHTQISLMGSIYRNAEATIVAAAGGDPTHGLPGAGSRSRNGQQTVSVGQQVLWSTRPDPKLVIERSTWMSRGWTYQEAFLSRRLIFFTEDQIYFECQTMHCRESIPPPLRLIHTKNKRQLHDGFHPGMFRQMEQDISCESVWRVIAEYSRRSMSFNEDALRGILGILAYLENCKRPVFHFWGVPIFTPALWIRGKRNALLLRVRGKLTHAFANALLWYHERPARRRPQFPSWSWTGWDGPLHSEHPYYLLRFHGYPTYYGCRCRKPTVEFSVETNSQNTIDWRNFCQRLPLRGGLGELTGVLRVKAWIVDLRFLHCPEGFPVDGYKAYSGPGFYAYFDADSVDTKYEGTFNNCRLYSYLSLSKKVDADEIGDLQERVFAGIVLGCSDEVQGDRMLVVDTSNEIAERVGILDLSRYSNYMRGTKDGDTKAPVVLTVYYNWGTVDTWKLRKTWRTIRLG